MLFCSLFYGFYLLILFSVTLITRELGTLRFQVGGRKLELLKRLVIIIWIQATSCSLPPSPLKHQLLYYLWSTLAFNSSRDLFIYLPPPPNLLNFSTAFVLTPWSNLLLSNLKPAFAISLFSLIFSFTPQERWLLSKVVLLEYWAKVSAPRLWGGGGEVVFVWWDNKLHWVSAWIGICNEPSYYIISNTRVGDVSCVRIYLFYLFTFQYY